MNKLATSLIALAAFAGGAHAADLPRRAAPPVFAPVPVFTWTGFYLGVNAGYAFEGRTSFRTFNDATPGASALGVPGSRPPLATVRTEGVTAGGQVGYNYQFTPGSGVVVGIEADAAYTDLVGGTAVILTNPANGVARLSTFRSQLDFLGTVRGRIGYAFDRVLVYGTGGLAYGDLRTATVFYQGTAVDTPLNYVGARSNIDLGYAVGGGIEYALPTDSFLNVFRSSAVTVKVEALYYDLGSRNVPVASIGVPGTVGAYGGRVSTDGVLARAGLNFKFGTF